MIMHGSVIMKISSDLGNRHPVTIDQLVMPVKMSSRNIFFSPVQPNFFLQDSESKYFFRKKKHKIKIE
jgi:hypothetical protein